MGEGGERQDPWGNYSKKVPHVPYYNQTSHKSYVKPALISFPWMFTTVVGTSANQLLSFVFEIFTKMFWVGFAMDDAAETILVFKLFAR